MANTDSDTIKMDPLQCIMKQLEDITKGQAALREGQTALQRSFDTKLEAFRSEFTSVIDTKFDALRSDLNHDIGSLSRKYDHMDQEINELKHTVSNASNNNTSSDSHAVLFHNIDMSLDGQDLTKAIVEIFRFLGNDENNTPIVDQLRITNCTRLKTRSTEKPGLVKVVLQSVDARRTLLKHKIKLAKSETHKKLFISQFLSHAEHLNKMNTEQIVSELNIDSLKMASNGRLIKRDGRRGGRRGRGGRGRRGGHDGYHADASDHRISDSILQGNTVNQHDQQPTTQMTTPAPNYPITQNTITQPTTPHQLPFQMQTTYVPPHHRTTAPWTQGNAYYGPQNTVSSLNTTTNLTCVAAQRAQPQLIPQ